VRIDVRRTEQLKRGGEIYGNHVRCKIVKNKVAPPFKVAEFDILYGEGISHAGEVLDFAINYDIIKKSGSWFSYNGERLGQGQETVRKLVEDNPEFLAELEEQVREIGMKNQLTDTNSGEFDLDDEDEDDIDGEFDIRTLGSEDDE
jgi:recombination protein RecA